jgi:hypothetical protein
MSNAARLRRFRERQANGHIILRLEVDEVALTELLVAAGLLPPATDHERTEIEAATERLLGTLIADETRFCATSTDTRG